MHSDSGKLPNEDHNFKFNYDLTSLNEINHQEKFGSPSLSFKFSGNKFAKFKLPQVFNNGEFIYSSNNELFSKDSNWINNVTRYFKPILNYIHSNKNPDGWEIDAGEIHDRQVIGRGNQGIVYCAIYRGRPVAVKEVKEKIETEIKYLKKLQHPNIINFIGITTSKPFYIVMEHCSKGHLYEKLENSDNVTRDLFVNWSKQIVKGMRYLHDNLIVHRDLKSLNLLINDANVLKICDFGNSKFIKDLESCNSMAGTPGWMAPEVIRNEKCSEKIDVWSFGVVLWELLFCQKPYKNLQLDNSAINYGIAHRTLSLPLPSTCPAKFKSIMLACWNYEARKRPDFHQIQVDLKAANKELLSNFSNERFIEIKRLWEQEINKNFSAMRMENESLSDDEKTMPSKILKIELQEKLQNVNDLLKKLEQREKYLKRKEKELGIRYDHKSSSNGLVNSLGRKLLTNLSKDKSSSLRLGRFVRNRSRRSYRLHYAQKQLNKGTAETRDAEIQTINFDFEEDGPLALLNRQFQTQCRASDSGYGGGDSTTSCLSTPNVKHKSILPHSYSSAPDHNENSNPNGTSSYHVSSTYRSSSCSSQGRQRTNSASFRLHNPSASSAGHYDHVNSELPGGYLEASFENSLMLKTAKKESDEYRTNLAVLSKESAVKESDTEISNDEKAHFSSDEDETQDLSVDSLNNNKYSEIYRDLRPSSESSSINSSLSWENNHRHDQTLINVRKIFRFSSDYYF